MRELVRLGFDEVIVVDGGSTDRTAAVAEEAGARVVVERRRGYGLACATGVAAVRADAAVVCFIDGDGSDDAGLAPTLVGPVMRGEADFAIGSRRRGPREPGSLTPQQVAAGALAGALMRMSYGVRYTEHGPVPRHRTGRARPARHGGDQLRLEPRDADAGRGGGGCASWKCRSAAANRVGGVSKVSGNLAATLPAAWTLARTYVRLAATLRKG